MKEATFGAGCFWGIEHAFRKIEGVNNTLVGYSGGDFPDPTYELVCSGKTGHAEVVRIEFDNEKTTFNDLLLIFFEIHDPTTLNRQGPDIGTQYRSAIYFHTPEQKSASETAISELNKTNKFINPIVTEIAPVKQFYKAEEYHQRYFEKQGRP